MKGFDESDYLPVLLDKHVDRDYSSREAKITPQAWDFFLADYFRNEQPDFSAYYERLLFADKEHGRVVPTISSLSRKVEKEITDEHRILWHKGEHALIVVAQIIIKPASTGSIFSSLS